MHKLILQLNLYQNNLMSKLNVIDLNSLTEENEVKQQVENIKYYYTDKNGFNKTNANNFLDQALINLDSKDSSPASKLMTILVIKELTQKNQVKLLSLLTGNKLFKFLMDTAQKVDPRKPVDQKGAKLFANQPETGRKFMRVLLQCVKVWGDKFGRAKDNEETKFYKNFKILKDKGVIFPNEYRYIDDTKIKRTGKRQDQSKQTIKVEKMEAMEERKDNKKHDNSMSHELNYTKQRIILFLGILDDEDDPEQLQRQIMSNHKFFQKQSQKYASKSEQIQNNSQDVEMFFNINHFLTQQQAFYLKFIPENKLQPYTNAVKDLAKQIQFIDPKQQKKQQKPPNEKQKKARLQIPQKYQQKPNIPYTASNMIGSKNVASSKQIRSDQKVLLSNLYSKFQARSKSPHEGFKAVQKSLQKQKQIAKQNPLKRTGRSPSPITKSHAVLKSSALKESKIHTIFNNPPNPRVMPKSYEGQLVRSNKELEKVLFNIKKDQGNKRFKISNFREKNPLFENDHIQIGYKSQAVYENIHNFHNFIEINLFIGNKTNDVIKDFQIQYKADKNQLLYANPRNVDSVIPAGYQNKHDLMIIPLKQPFSFLVGNVSYSYQNTSVHTTVALPNSILKFASYMQIQKMQFQETWEAISKFKTSSFQLCKFFPPDKMNKWIPILTPFTKYEDFIRSGSETDYEIGCHLTLFQTCEAMLKISINPNLQVTLQIGIIDESPEAAQYFKTYIQTLELILKETD